MYSNKKDFINELSKKWFTTKLEDDSIRLDCNLIFYSSTYKKIYYQDTILDLFSILIKKKNMIPIEVEKKIIGLKNKTNSVILWNNNKLSLLGSFKKNIHHIKFDLDRNIKVIRELSEYFSISFLPLGFNPFYFENHNDTVSPTSKVKVMVNYKNELDMIKKMRIGLAIQPLVAALFASSPIKEYGISSVSSNQLLYSRKNSTLDINRVLDFTFSSKMSFESYVVYLLDNLYRINSKKKYEEFNDLVIYIENISLEVRINQFIEMRGCDMVPFHLAMALPAFWMGILNDIVIEEIYQIISKWPINDIKTIYKEIPYKGLNSEFSNKKTIFQVLQDIIYLAKKGLNFRKLGESSYLWAIEEILEQDNPRIYGTYSERITKSYKSGRNILDILEDYEV